MPRLTTAEIRRRKGVEPLVVLTAYSAPVAKLLDPHTDILLVGDSLGMVLYGMPDTLGVTLEMMIQHGLAVMRGSERSCVVVDMPFGSYQTSPQQAFTSAAEVMARTSCQGVKLEGGAEMAETVAFMVARGIPVMGHVGLLPQHVHALGGFKVQGRDPASQERILADARRIEDAGAFALVVEGVIPSLADAITQAVSIPVIGIGASANCDGQVLVTEDMAGLFSDYTPKFVKRYGAMGEMLTAAASTYAEEVKARRFPGVGQLYRDS
jgi:3-methyl-2-oxobutanoate hydroxymethyltransferase